jgi:hypothetical protein
MIKKMALSISILMSFGLHGAYGSSSELDRFLALDRLLGAALYNSIARRDFDKVKTIVQAYPNSMYYRDDSHDSILRPLIRRNNELESDDLWSVDSTDRKILKFLFESGFKPSDRDFVWVALKNTTAEIQQEIAEERSERLALAALMHEERPNVMLAGRINNILNGATN